MSVPARWAPPLPVDRGQAGQFFDALEHGVFLLRTNGEGEFFDPRDALDEAGRALVPVQASGRGRVESWSLIDDGGSDDSVRSYAAIVRFDEGPWWWGRLVVPSDVDRLLHLRVRMVVARPRHEDARSAPVPYWIPDTD